MKKPSALSILGGLLLLLAACALAPRLSGHPGLRPPQAEQPELLSVLFGESRVAIGERLYYLADVYYHAGIGYANHRNDHHHDHHDGHHHHHDDDREAALFPFAGEDAAESAAPLVDHCDHDHHDGHAQHHEDSRRREHGGDWWIRINRRLKPRGHRHLHGRREEREILPWLWAAVKVDPKHIDAYLDGAYFLAERLGRPDEGLRMLDEGLRHNPGSVRIYFARGTMLFHRFDDREGAFSTFAQGREAWLEQWEDWRQTMACGQTEAEQPDTLIYYRLLGYMGHIAERQERPEQALALYGEALPFSPSPRLRDQLLARIEGLEAR